MRLVIGALLLIGCKDRGSESVPMPVAITRPTDAPASVPPPPRPARKGMRWLVLPEVVSDIRYAMPQAVDVELQLARFPTYELQIQPQLEVLEHGLIAVSGLRPTPNIVRWANDHRILLEISCRNPIPAELRYVSCARGELQPERFGDARALETLQIAINSSFTDADLAKLPVSMPSLVQLDLKNTGITREGFSTLARYPRLASLDLAGTRLGTLDGIQELRLLTALDVGATALEDGALSPLTQLKLQSLTLSFNDLTDRAAPTLAKLTDLRLLALSGTQITDKGLAALGTLARLEYLDVTETKVTRAGCAALDNRLGRKVCDLDGRPAAPDTGPGSTTTIIDTLTVIDLSPDDGPLEQQLRTHRAAAKGRKLVVETTAAWCPPCIGFDKHLRDPAMLAALANVTLVRVDFDRFDGKQLESVGIPSSSVPWFVLIDDRIRVVDGISSSEWDDDVPANMAPVLSAFVRGTYKTRRRSWTR